VERDDQFRLTLLTVLILALMGVLIAFTGYQSVVSEQHFFRRMAFDANRELARMVAREFVHVFTSQTSVIDDLASLPPVFDKDLETTRFIFKMMIDRHYRFRSIYLMDIEGNAILTSLSAAAPSESDIQMLQPEAARNFLNSRRNYFFTDPYSPGPHGLAITYAAKVLDREGTPVGLVAGELDFSFLGKILGTIQLGRTGQLLVTDRLGSVLFTSRAFDDADRRDFKNFDVDKAYAKAEGKGFMEYDGIPNAQTGQVEQRLSSFARIHAIASEPDPLDLGRAMFPIPIKATKLPDWMIVAQQHANEALEIADRMKYNVIALVIAGIFGAMVILKLWFDSLPE